VLLGSQPIHFRGFCNRNNHSNQLENIMMNVRPSLISLLLCAFLLCSIRPTAAAQNQLRFLLPVIYSKLTVTNHFGPERKISGHALGYGLGGSYILNPGFIIRHPKFRFEFGGGYFTQRFNLERPFHYDSPFEPVFYTEYYSYKNFATSIGLRYSLISRNEIVLDMSLSYQSLFSFTQIFAPTAEFTVGSNKKQKRDNSYFFSDSLPLGFSVTKSFDRVAAGVELIVPLYQRWKNDRIFDDHPDTWTSPRASFGFGLQVRYELTKL
jgi:hypothetical protein